MRTPGWPLALAATVIGGAALTRAADRSAPDAERFQPLIARLGSGLFREREAASRELDAFGEAALASLRQAAHAGDPEVRRRAAELVERIGGRLAAARLLAATPVSFDYRDTPLTEAVADLARRTGAPLRLMRRADSRDRTVTARTAALPFWEALGLFCRQAGVHEWDGLAPLRGDMAAGPQGPNPRPRQDAPAFGPVLSADSLPWFMLLDGPGPDLPAHHAGAVRVRCLPSAAASPESIDGVTLPLQIATEPKLHWLGVQELRVTRAVDDRGQALPATVVAPALPSVGDELVLLPNGRLAPRPRGQHGPVGVRIRADAPGQRLGELAGLVTAQVRVTEPVLALNAPAAGLTAPGDVGGSLKVADFARDAAGEVRVTAEVELPPGVQPVQPPGGGILAGLPGAQVVPGGVMIRPVPAVNTQMTVAGGTDCQGLTLEDARGRRYAVLRGHAEFVPTPQGGTFRIAARFGPPERGSEPVRLVVLAHRAVTVEVPFSLRDVPLP